jgi:hypothetical protein
LQTAPTAARLEQAKRLFREGNELRRTGDCQRALLRYLRSRELVPSVPNTINAAYCLNELNRYDEALELYEELMVRFSAELSEEDRLSLAPVMATLREQVASLDISSNTTGLVVVDGRPRGRLPLATPLRVLAGRRTVRVIEDGWVTFERTLTLRPGETTKVDALLKQLVHRGSLHVKSTKPGTVYIDGSSFGPAPWQGVLVPGRHVYFVRGAVHGSAPAAVTVIEGQVVEVVATAALLGPECRVRVDPPTAELSIDGVRLSAGSWRGRLPRGVHRFEATEVGYRASTQSIDPATDSDIVLTLAVDPAHPRWKTRGELMLRAEGLVGFALGPGIGSGAERSCDTYACPENDPALGIFAAGRFGYELSRRITVEASIGYFAFRTNVTRGIRESFIPISGTESVRTQYSIKDELSLLGPFASLGGSYSWLLGQNLLLAIGAHAGGWIVSGSDRARGSVSGAGGQTRLAIEGSGETTRSTDLFFMLDGRLRTKIGAVDLSAGFLATAFVLEGPAGSVGDVHPTGTCSTARVVACAPGEPFISDRKEPTHGPFVAFGPYASVAHRF